MTTPAPIPPTDTTAAEAALTKAECRRARRRTVRRLEPLLHFTTEDVGKTPAVLRGDYTRAAWAALTPEQRKRHLYQNLLADALAYIAAHPEQSPDPAYRPRPRHAAHTTPTTPTPDAVTPAPSEDGADEAALPDVTSPTSTAPAPVLTPRYFVDCDDCGEPVPTASPRPVRRATHRRLTGARCPAMTAAEHTDDEAGLAAPVEYSFASFGDPDAPLRHTAGPV